MNSQVETTESIIVPEMANKNLIKKGLFVLLLGIVIYVILDYTVPGLGFVSDILTNFLEWVEENPALGAIAFACTGNRVRSPCGYDFCICRSHHRRNTVIPFG